MQAIVSLLEESAYGRIEAIWRVLELRCGLKGIKVTPYPHFSWQVAEYYVPNDLENAIEKICASSRPLVVKTSGLGIFTGPIPVVYVAIAKDEKLMRFHKKIWNAVKHMASGSNLYYDPDAWIPHVTLAHGDVNKEGLLCAMEELGFVPFNWEMKIDNLTIVGQAGNEIGHLEHRYDFMKKRLPAGRTSEADPT